MFLITHHVQLIMLVHLLGQRQNADKMSFTLTPAPFPFPRGDYQRFF